MSEKNKTEKYIFVGNDQQIGKMILRKNAIIEEKTYDEIMKNEENKKLNNLFIPLEKFNDYKRNVKAFSENSMKKFRKKEIKKEAQEDNDAPKSKGGKNK